jgi:hypothetical protein
MHCTYPNQRHAARRVDISSCSTTQPNHRTMAPSSQLHRFSRRSCPKSRGQGGGSLHQLQRSHSCPPYPQIHGPSPTSDPNVDRQHHCPRHCQQQCYQEIESSGHEIPLAPQQRTSRTILTLLGPRQREQRQLRDKTSCCNSSPSDTPNFPHKYIYLTCTTPTTQPTTHRQTSCSKGVLDIYYTTVWYNLHTYSKSPNKSLLVPLFILGQTWAD